MAKKDDDQPHVEPARPPAYPLEEALENALTPRPAGVDPFAEGETLAVKPGSEVAPAIPDNPAEVPPQSVAERLSSLPPWQARYVLALMELAGVSVLACRVVGVSRESVMKAQAASLDFAQACAAAVENATDLLEAASFHRATVGVLQPVYQSGLLVGYKRVASPKDAEIMLKIRGRLKDEQQVNVKTTCKVELLQPSQMADRLAEVTARLFGQPKPVLEAEIVEGE